MLPVRKMKSNDIYEDWAQRQPLRHYEDPVSSDHLVRKWDDGEPLPWYLTVRGLLIEWLNRYIFRR